VYFFFLFNKLHLVLLTLWVLVPSCLELVWNLSVQVLKRQPDLLGLFWTLPGLNCIYEFALVSIYLTKLLLGRFKGPRGTGERKAQPVDPVWTLNNPSQLTSSVTSVIPLEVRSPACMLGTASPSWFPHRWWEWQGKRTAILFQIAWRFKTTTPWDLIVSSARPQNCGHKFQESTMDLIL
jgi:hypothetical protein